jgi:hypothetical protein
MRKHLELVEFSADDDGFVQQIFRSRGALPGPALAIAQSRVERKLCDMETVHDSSLEDPDCGRKAEQFSHEQNWQKT